MLMNKSYLGILWVVMLSMVTSMFLLIKSPLGLGVLLFLLSLLVVLKIGLMISSWYGYMLFLVYVGGLLVMFIYICMISSNSQLGVSNLSLNLMPLVMLNLLVFSQYVVNQKMVTYSGLLMNGVNLPFYMLLLLGVYLLVCFVVVVNIIFSGGSLVELEN